MDSHKSHREAVRLEPRGHKLVSLDWAHRRVWIGSQRLHHGATGAAIALMGVLGVAARRVPARDLVPMTLMGGLLMAHDWHDRSVWFQRGPQLD